MGRLSDEKSPLPKKWPFPVHKEQQAGDWFLAIGTNGLQPDGMFYVRRADVGKAIAFFLERADDLVKVSAEGPAVSS